MCTHTLHAHEVFTCGCFLLVSHRMHIQSSYFVSVLQIIVRVFLRVFRCRIGLQTMRSVEQSIEDLSSAEIKEPVTSECRE